MSDYLSTSPKELSLEDSGERGGRLTALGSCRAQYSILDTSSANDEENAASVADHENHDLIKSNPFTKNFKKLEKLFQKNHTTNSQICIGVSIFCVGLMFAGVLLIIFRDKEADPKLDNTDIEEPLPEDIVLTSPVLGDNGEEEQRRPGDWYSATRSLPEVTIIYNYHLRTIKPSTESVIVKKLTAPAFPGPAGLSHNCCNSVRNLTIDGAISSKWLHYLLSSFTKLETLTINVDSMSSVWVKNSPILEEFSTVTLPELDTMNLNNAKKWPILNLKFGLVLPKLRTIFVSDASLHYLPTCEHFISFLTSYKTSLESISITRSSINSECEFPAFPNLKYMSLTKLVETEIINQVPVLVNQPDPNEMVETVDDGKNI